MKTIRMAAAAVLAFTLMACGGVPPPEPASEPSSDPEVSAQACTTYYICDSNFSRRYSSASSCASFCASGANGCSEERLCCTNDVCEWL